jgi:competence protein ComEA
MLKSLSASVLLACTVFAAAAPVCVATAAEARRVLTTDNPFAQASASAVPKTNPAPISAQPSKANTASASGETVNINQADAATLDRVLIGIGAKKAEAIVAYRQAHGAFARIEDLDQVKGIGAATIDKNRSRMRVK